MESMGQASSWGMHVARHKSHHVHHLVASLSYITHMGRQYLVADFQEPIVRSVSVERVGLWSGGLKSSGRVALWGRLAVYRIPLDYIHIILCIIFIRTTCIQTHIHACLHTYIHACILAYIHTYMHTYIYTCIHADV